MEALVLESCEMGSLSLVLPCVTPPSWPSKRPPGAMVKSTVQGEHYLPSKEAGCAALSPQRWKLRLGRPKAGWLLQDVHAPRARTAPGAGAHCRLCGHCALRF